MARYTHGHAESVLRSHRRRTAQDSCGYLLPHLRPGDRLLDVGSGPGTITADLAGLVAEVVALEATEQAAALTAAELERRGITNATTVVADVHDLGAVLEPGSFDVVHAHQVLQHVADPVVALREMARVSRRLVAARDSDYASFAWHPGLPVLDRWLALYDAAARANGGEPQAGRRLLEWAHAAGLDDVTPSSSTWCFATPADREWWGGMWADRIQTSALADQLLDQRLAGREELEAIADGWRAWAADPDGWISLHHGEVLARVGR
jgi:SAM-dependent methyltransferase